MSLHDPPRGVAAHGGSLQHAAGFLGRLVQAWRALPGDRRLAAGASLGLFISLFLPWYQRAYFVIVAGRPQPGSDTQTAWGAFSFVEAAVLVVAVGVLTLLFKRAEGRPFHLPGGDGWVISAAGVWACILIIWRIFDKQGATSQTQAVTSYGIEWGIFAALADAGLLVYAGSRVRAARQPEPPLPGASREPGDERGWGPSGWSPPTRVTPPAPRGKRSANPPAGGHRRRDPFAAVDELAVDEPPELQTRPQRRRPAAPPADQAPTRMTPGAPGASRPQQPRRPPGAGEDQLTIPLEDPEKP